MIANEYGLLRRVALRAPDELFAPDRIVREWRELGFASPPDAGLAREQFAAFAARLAAHGPAVDYLPADTASLTLDAIYVRDASVVTPRGIVLCRMGKAARSTEPPAQREAFQALGLPIAGAIEPPGLLEGGDVVWFDAQTVAVGQGYRTNEAGIRQLRELVGPGVSVMVVPLPHYRGPGDVFHLMSILSPVDRDLAVVYSPLTPVPFRQWLCERGIAFVEVPDEEFLSMGANVLAVSPRRCVMLDGNSVTRARLEAAGADVAVYEGSEISLKGGGGPTCLTRPLERG